MKAVVLLAALLLGILPAAAAEFELVNRSTATRCAEEDNVHVDLHMPASSRLRIEARQPAYAATLTRDIRAPDFTHCDMSGDPSFPFEARTETLYEDAALKIVGITQPTFWRNHAAVTVIGGHEWRDLHFVQFFRKQPGKEPFELLVVYPIDGYWRLKPPPPRLLDDNVYGSSFLIGPIEVQKRPVVDIDRLVFEPATRTFRVGFSRGGGAVARVVAIDAAHIALDVDLDVPAGWTGPLVSLRSMYVTEDNADTAEIAWREGGAWRRSLLMAVERLRSPEVRFERRIPSRHNTSAPDLLFRLR